MLLVETRRQETVSRDFVATAPPDEPLFRTLPYETHEKVLEITYWT
jgi:hypothetical protein